MQHNCAISSRSLVCLFALTLAVATANLVSAADLSGQWQGYWQSDDTGHRGVLRCTFTKIDETSYRANFSGRFFKIIPFRYSVVLDAVDHGDVVHLSGSQAIGRRYGTFYYSATATCSEFNATFTSCKDSGQFVLTRCCCCCGK
jgi:hypothetical protein